VNESDESEEKAKHKRTSQLRQRSKLFFLQNDKRKPKKVQMHQISRKSLKRTKQRKNNKKELFV